MSGSYYALNAEYNSLQSQLTTLNGEVVVLNFEGARLPATQSFTGINTFTQSPLCTAVQPASNNSSTIMPTTAWVQGAIALNVANLTYINQVISVVTLPPAGSLSSINFTDTLTLPSAGTWLITGTFTTNFLITGVGATSTTTQGWSVVGFGGLSYYDFSTQTGLAIPNGLSILKRFTMTSLYTTASPVTLTGTANALNTQYGTEFSGNISAIKISSV